MTNAEAIEILRANYPDACFEQLRAAVDKAVEALEAQDATGDSISRQAAIKSITWHKGVVDKSVAKRILIQLPSAQPERKNGAWINEGRIIRCNRCKIGYATVKGMKSALTYKFCPNCGARMEGDHETD